MLSKLINILLTCLTLGCLLMPTGYCESSPEAGILNLSKVSTLIAPEPSEHQDCECDDSECQISCQRCVALVFDLKLIPWQAEAQPSLQRLFFESPAFMSKNFTTRLLDPPRVFS